MKRILMAAMMALLVLTMAGCNTTKNPNVDYCVESNVKGVYTCEKRLTSYFDTTMSLKLYYTQDDTQSISDIFNYFEDTIALYHKYLDKYHAYDGITNVYTINHSDGPVTLDQTLFDAISYALANDDIIVRDQLPLFDIALNPVLEIWHNARESDLCYPSSGEGFPVDYCPVPRDQIDQGTFNTDPSDILLDPDHLTISFAKENMSIDLGGMSKGYVTKILSEHLDELGISYLIDSGDSNVVGGGSNPIRSDGLFYLALITPNTEPHVFDTYFMYLKVPEHIAVVTSGNYQRFFIGEDDHLVYHHIIDPRTNYPGGDVMSVTLLYPDSALADILSTAIYLLPLNDALTFVNQYPNLEAVWYKTDGTVEYSDGFAPYIYVPENQ